MAMKVQIKGLRDIENKLSQAVKGILSHDVEAISLAAQFIKGESQELTSIKFGTLFKSAFTNVETTKKGTRAVIGYTAEYAPHVHEMPDDTNWNRPGAENEFLEKAAVRNLGSVVNLIKNIMERNP